MVKGEFSNLKSIAKRIVPKDLLRKIRKVDNKVERFELYKHAIKIHLERKMAAIEESIERHKKNHDVFSLIARSKLLNLKIKYFYVTHHKKDLKVALGLLGDIEKELSDLSKESERRGFMKRMGNVGGKK